jgi:hypothetical protein
MDKYEPSRDLRLSVTSDPRPSLLCRRVSRSSFATPMRSAADGLAEDEDRSDEQDGVARPHGPGGVDGAGLGKVHHQQDDRVIDQQNRQEAEEEGRQELTTRLQD